MKRLFPALALWTALALPALAECGGKDLIAALPDAGRSALLAEAEVPFATGNFWTATKGQARLLLIGTYHLADPRFSAMTEALAPALSQARELLVELSPADEVAFKAWLGSHPEAIFDQAGPSLKDQLSPQDWQALSEAVSARGTPAAAVLKMRPWVVVSMLEAPACLGLSPALLSEGFDHQLTATAEAQGLPIRSLEPYDTAVKVFASLSPQDQLDMIRQALMTEPRAEDLIATLTGAYLRGESRLYLAFAHDMAIRDLGLPAAEVDRQTEVMFEALLDRRNAAWIPVLEQAANQGPVVAAFGALHLSGEKGVLNLLARDGWTLAPYKLGTTWP